MIKEIVLNEKEWAKIDAAVININVLRRSKIKSSMELKFPTCDAKIYHMASENSDNPTVRIDLKMKD